MNLLAARDTFGVERWPSAQMELVFQVAAFVLLFALQSDARFRGRLFFLYLGIYGVFRFAHEWMRDTPRLAAGLSGYQFIAFSLVALGTTMFVRRGPTNASAPLA
jgi:prolipoprotein diacylglyceryltransferase